MIPCGGIEEVNEVVDVINKEYGTLENDFYALNLIGHGCIMMSSDVERLKNLNYIGRTFPEIGD